MNTDTTPTTEKIVGVDQPRLVLPSSLTPETDQLHAQRENVHSAYFLMRTHAERLERQRNCLIEALEYIAHAGLSGRHMEDVARAALSQQNANIQP